MELHTNDRFVREHKGQHKELFVAGVQLELAEPTLATDTPSGGGLVTFIYRDTGFIKRVAFKNIDKFLKTARRVGGGLATARRRMRAGRA